MAYSVKNRKKDDPGHQHLFQCWRELHDAALEGEGLEEGRQEWLRQGYSGAKFPEVVAWFDREIERAEAYREARARARAEKACAEFFTNWRQGDPVGRHIWGHLDDHRDLYRHYVEARGLVMSLRPWWGYFIEQQEDKFLVRGFAVQKDLKQFRIDQRYSVPTDRGWKKQALEIFDTYTEAKQFVSQLEAERLQFSFVGDMTAANAPGHDMNFPAIMARIRKIAVMVRAYYSEPIHPGDKFGAYVALYQTELPEFPGHELWIVNDPYWDPARYGPRRFGAGELKGCGWREWLKAA